MVHREATHCCTLAKQIKRQDSIEKGLPNNEAQLHTAHDPSPLVPQAQFQLRQLFLKGGKSLLNSNSSLLLQLVDLLLLLGLCFLQLVDDLLLSQQLLLLLTTLRL